MTGSQREYDLKSIKFDLDAEHLELSALEAVISALGEHPAFLVIKREYVPGENGWGGSPGYYTPSRQKVVAEASKFATVLDSGYFNGGVRLTVVKKENKI